MSVESLSKRALLDELRRLTEENAELRRTRGARRLSETARFYLDIMENVYGAGVWTTPQCVHLHVREDEQYDYQKTKASSSAFASLLDRGLIEKEGSAVRLPSEAAEAAS